MGTLCKCKKVNYVSAKRSNPRSGVHSRCTVTSRYAVHSRSWCKKVNSHSVLSKYGWWGPLPLVQKGQTHRVGYAVNVSTKRSNSCSGVCSRYTVRSRCKCKKGQTHTVGYTVGTQYAVGVSTKKVKLTQWGYAVCSRC